MIDPAASAPAPRSAGSLAFATCCAAFALFHIYTSFTGSYNPLIQRGVFIGGALTLAWWSLATQLSRPLFLKMLLWLLAALSLATALHVMISHDRFMDVMSDLTHFDMVMAGITIALLIVVTQRLLGWALPVMTGIGLIYFLWGNSFIGGMWQPPRVSAETALSLLYASTGGVFGFMADIGTGVIAIYIIFGALLMATGAGEVFVQVANRIAGRGHGGPAKIAVVTSGLFGTVSGSAVANVMAVGSMTIPLMRRAGYSKAFAAGVEASASAGGQIMPPIMGAGAFLMAQLLNIPYIEVAKAAALPAILYFAMIFVSVDLFARKNQLSAIPMPHTPISLEKALPLAGSVAVMIYLLADNYTATFAGAMATVTLVVMALICRLVAAALREGLRGLPGAVASMARDSALGAVDGGKGLIMISVLLGCVGILTALIGATGLGTKVSGELIALAGDRLLLALIMSAVLCMLLGMDVPTTASYVLTASVAAPLLAKLGLPALTAHLFIFYFAILSAITPPVCASVFAAAAIAGESFWRVARYALLIAGGVYFLPFMMVYRPGLLLTGSLFDIVYATFITAIAMFCLSSASIGYLWGSLSIPARLLMAAIAFLYFLPGLVYDASASLLLAGFVLVQRGRAQRALAVTAPTDARQPPPGDPS